MATASGDEANLDGLNTSTSAGTSTASDSKNPMVNNPHSHNNLHSHGKQSTITYLHL